LRAVDRRACRVEVEEIFAAGERLLLPLRREVLVDADAMHYRAADAVLLGGGRHIKKETAPAAALHHDALGIDVAARCKVVQGGGEHALRADVDQDRRLPGARHVDGEDADARIEVSIGACDDFLLARVEAVDAEDERHRPRGARDAQVGDDLAALERDVHRLDRRRERFRVRLKGIERARIVLLLCRREPLARPARDVEDVPGVEVIAARVVALTDAAPRRYPVVRVERVQARHRFARIVRLDAGERNDVALGAAHRFLFQLFERARSRALRERCKRHCKHDCYGEAANRRSRSFEKLGPRFRRGDERARHSTSTMHSISTGMPIGRDPMPTAERACLPRSPNTSTKRSEQPLITFGWSSNSGTALTMPSSFTTRRTLSRLPSSARITARRSMPTARACW